MPFRYYSLLFFVIVSPFFAQQVTLQEQGRSKCVIILAAEAPAWQARAARELAEYLGRISGGEIPAVVSGAVPGKLPVYLELNRQGNFGQDEFRWLVTPQAIRIQAGERQALFYGIYRLLKEYCGIRWLVPGSDGEYFTVQPTLRIPCQDSRQRPAFPVRTIALNAANTSELMTDSWDWMLRNNFCLAAVHGHAHTTKQWKPELGEALQARGVRIAEGRMFGEMFTGARISIPANRHEQEMKQLFAARPDCFPLVKGQRVIMRGYEQPCTSNPEVIRRMAEHTTLWSKRISGEPAVFAIINDDGTTWCECERCQALDPAVERQQNFRSTRYWTLLQQIFRETLEKYPEVIPAGLAYQNFQTVPEGMRIDPRMRIGLSFNRRCFRHRLEDPGCPTNRIFLKYYTDWGKLPNQCYSREELHAGIGKNYMPSEAALIDGFRVYRKLGIAGANICTVPVDGVYRPFYDDTIRLGWFCEWQALYLAGEFLWNPDADYEIMLEEANRLYYGAAWPGGMRDFRELLTRSCQNAPSCFGWGHGTHPGQAISQPGVLQKLEECLSAAETAAAGDPRALAHVRRDRHLFRITLAKNLQLYQESFRELTAFTSPEAPVIDGKFTEKVWEKASSYANFIKFKGEKTAQPNIPAAYPVFLRPAWDSGHIYLAVDAMEPAPAGILRRHGPGEAPWGDEALEIFLSHPNFNGDYYQFAFNTTGALYQAQTKTGNLLADTGIDSGIRIAVAVLDDRWQAEISIPVARLGQSCGAGHTWQLNVARSRRNADGVSEQSSLAGGQFHGAFLPLHLAEERDPDSGKAIPLWQNASFNDVFKRPNEKWVPEWQLNPEELLARGWSLNGKTGDFQLIRNEATPGDYYVLLRKGNFFQIHHGRDQALRYSFKAAGQGKLRLLMFRFKRGKHPEIIRSEQVREILLNSDSWQTFSGDYRKPDPEEVTGLDFWHLEGKIKIDDAFMFGIAPEQIRNP